MDFDSCDLEVTSISSMTGWVRRGFRIETELMPSLNIRYLINDLRIVGNRLICELMTSVDLGPLDAWTVQRVSNYHLI